MAQWTFALYVDPTAGKGDATSISGALAMIPASGPGTPDFFHRWTIWVLPGFYVEEFTCRPFVNIIGTNKSAVFILPGGPPGDRVTARLAHHVELRNLTL